MPSSTSLKPHQTALLAAGAASAVVWAMPVVQELLLPLMYLNTHLHEFCHAVMDLAVGGRVSDIKVFSNGSGVTNSAIPGGVSILFVASAGYIGAALIGAAMILIGRTPQSARNVLWSLGAILSLSLLLWVRGDLIGWISGVFWAGALLTMGRYLKANAILFAVQFIAVQQCLNSLQSLYTLFQISAFSEGQSDARIMEQASGIPAIFWAVSWALFSLVMVGFALRSVWRQGGSPAPGR